jgi:hypothetical protein
VTRGELRKQGGEPVLLLLRINVFQMNAFDISGPGNNSTVNFVVNYL